MTNTNGRTPRPHRQSRKHGQVRRQAATDTRPERQEPQRSENIEKMAAVFDSAVTQRHNEAAQFTDALADWERELLDPHVYVSSAADDFAAEVRDDEFAEAEVW